MPVPPGVVTAIRPDVAPNGTVVVIEVADTTVKFVATTPLNCTAVAPVKLNPVIVTAVPTNAPVGVRLVMVGAGINVNGVPLVAAPPFVCTVI